MAAPSAVVPFPSLEGVNTSPHSALAGSPVTIARVIAALRN